MKDLRTIILAAGKGTRMKSGTPKVLHTVCGKALIDYVVHVAEAVGSLKIYAVLGHQLDVVKAHLGTRSVVVEQKELLGTADAVRRCAKVLAEYSGDVLVLCGDTVLLRQESVRQLLNKHRRSNAACTVMTVDVADPFGYGRIIRAQGQMLAIREEKDASPAEKEVREINVGVYCFNSKLLFSFLKAVKLNVRKREFYLTDVVELLVNEGEKVETLKIADANEGEGINDREELAFAAAVIRERILKDLMASGVTVIDPKTTHVSADAKIGQDTVLQPFTVIENNVQVGRNCVIGPFAHLRPGTRLADQVQIGNFAEVSRTRMGSNSLMKHFSFVGDAIVGKNVNIGAGTVTANYDGKNKNQTVIADRAFIGSDSILVAPVTVGRGSITGAGCVVKKGTVVPAGKIAVGVPARILDKKRKF